jgi:RNA polymerase sigma-70 factor, ECF subfamily
VDGILESAIEIGQTDLCDPDAKLMASIRSGNSAAFEDLVQRHQDRAWRLAWRMLGDEAEAQDVVQEAFLKILRAAPRYRPLAMRTS